MNRRWLLLAISLLISTPVLADEPIARRIEARGFPSVFQAWSPADSLPDEEQWTTVARHDLVFHAPDFFGLKWKGPVAGLAIEFAEEGRKRGEQVRKDLLRKNPNLIILAELRYRDAHRSYLPEDHPWWKRQSGKKVIGWEEGGYFLLDFSNPDYVAQVARQAKAIMDSGVFDGLMLDWWEDDDRRLALIREIRKTIGDDPLVLVNANDRKTPKTAEWINGYFMECYRTKTPEDWKQVADTLQWAEANLKAPRINCLETWYHSSRDDLDLMRATTTLSMTTSNGYCLFSDPNPLPTADHLHDWYPFWDHDLGRPKSPGAWHDDGSCRREFQRGTAVYNPPGNHPVSVEFPTPRTAASSGHLGTSFTVAPGDGDLFSIAPVE